jgi:hypothetical protein
MKQDVLDWSNGKGRKRVSKETLNHRGLIEMVSGMDAYQQTPEAYRRAYEALGIDVINRVPLENAPLPTPPGTVRGHPDKPYDIGALGFYDTVCRREYPCRSEEDVWALDMDGVSYADLLVPVAHGCESADIQARAAAIGEVGLYYALYYTTLFMWGVEVLGWEMFMLAAMEDPGRFHERFLLPCVAKSRRTVGEITAATDSPFVFLHDDLATATGPVFNPRWYDDYVFPHYGEIFEPAKTAGKKVIMVADGNMSAFLDRMVEVGVDGFMFESPATPLEAVAKRFGKPGRFFIGGIETAKLTFGTPAEIKRMVYDVADATGGHAGFAMASGGGLHGNIPLENLVAYFDARAETGFTPVDWQFRYRK